MTTSASWNAWTEREWRDQVADEDEEFARCGPDFDAFVDDMKDMARVVVECTVEPLRAFAEGFPRAMAFDSRQWHQARRWSDPNKAWRYARRRWRL